MHIGIRWKSEKDSQRYRWVWWGVAAETCYMCKGLLPKTKKKTNDQSISDIDEDENEETFDETDTDIRYIRICEKCTELNQLKKASNCDLTGKNCLVTGGRTKIGYEIALRLLRNGGNVIITTRFPFLAAAKFKEEIDSDEWISRLSIFGCDFRDLKLVSELIEFVREKWNKLDVLINNELFPLVLRDLVTMDFRSLPAPPKTENIKNSTSSTGLVPFPYLDSTKTEQTSSAVLSQVPIPGEIFENTLFSHPGSVIKNDPVDLRAKTSWNSLLEDIHMMEVAEVLVINTFVPSLLLQQLEPLLLKPPFDPPR
ncbi:hypothetical protein HK096_010719 [Nowakowskiella sp. JEL0078]|nr:hypothetical protein HK096_010719 [Nowakowskiella sp. JEL0078]